MPGSIDADRVDRGNGGRERIDRKLTDRREADEEDRHE